MRLASALLIASCGVHASIATVMGQVAEPAVVAQRPKILPDRWQEDWSALADPRIERERFDNLKYIPLSNNDPGTYLSLGLIAPALPEELADAYKDSDCRSQHSFSLAARFEKDENCCGAGGR